jgi:hypothetical protein
MRYTVIHWPCIQYPALGPQPTNARCARGEELEATEFDCGASLLAVGRGSASHGLLTGSRKSLHDVRRGRRGEREPREAPFRFSQ